MEGEEESGPRCDWGSRQGLEHAESRKPQEGVWILISNALGVLSRRMV